MRGGAAKIIGMEKINFSIKFGSEDQKDFYPRLRLVDAGRLPPFGKQFLLGGYVHSMAGRDGMLSCGSRFLLTNLGVKTKKKVFSANLSLRLMFTCVLRPRTRLCSRLERHKHYFGDAQT